MLSFGVKNLRRLHDMEPIDIKPITILVGRNSSGKSTFLRALPLLRQSALTRTSSPILWFGDFVDFGSYEGAVSNNDVKRHIAFRFSLDDLIIDARRYFSASGYMIVNATPQKISAECEVTLRLHREVVQTYLIKVIVNQSAVYEVTIDDAASVSSLTVDGEDCLKYFVGVKLSVAAGSIFPTIFATPDRVETIDRVNPHSEIRAAATYLSKLYRPWLDKRLRDEAVVDLCAGILLESDITKEHLESLAEKSSVRSFAKLLKDMANKDAHALYDITEKVQRASRIVTLFRAFSERLREIVSSILYIGPARARSERYYRYQDLSVSEIDSDGKNFPMFLNSLRDNQFRSLSSWVESLFGYKLELMKSPGHISINVVEGTAKTNVVDTGYGVSQILPVLGQIWWSFHKPTDQRRSRSAPPPSFLVIEQPELHLHPAHQAFLADALVEIAGRTRAPSRNATTHFIIETHSETLVNRLGQMIEEGRLKSTDVQVVLFEPDKDDAQRRTSVRIAKFGEEGQLINWPFGFFQPSDA